MQVRVMLAPFLLFASGFVAAPFVIVGMFMLIENAFNTRISQIIFGIGIVVYLLFYMGLWLWVKRKGISRSLSKQTKPMLRYMITGSNVPWITVNQKTWDRSIPNTGWIKTSSKVGNKHTRLHRVRFQLYLRNMPYNSCFSVEDQIGANRKFREFKPRPKPNPHTNLRCFTGKFVHKSPTLIIVWSCKIVY